MGCIFLIRSGNLIKLRKKRKIIQLVVVVLIVLTVVAIGEWFTFRTAKKAFSELLFQDALNSASVLIVSCRTVYEFQVLREIERESMLIYASNNIPEKVGRDDLEVITELGHLPLAILLDNDGEIIGKSGAIPPDIYPWLSNIEYYLPGIFKGTIDREIFGIDRELPLTEGPKVLAQRVSNGIVVLFAPEPTVKEREELTVGKLIGRLGENPRVRYLALQDENGFIFATKSVRVLSSISADPFLGSVLKKGEPAWRYIDFSDEKVFELAIKFPQMGIYQGVLRVGLSTKQQDALLFGYFIQLAIILFLALAVSIVAIAYFFATRQLAKEKSLSDAILSGMNAGCVAVDSEGLLTLINPGAQRIFSLQKGRGIGEKYENVFAGDSLRLRETLLNKSGSVFRVDIEKGNEKRTLDVSTGVLPDGGAFAVAEDITDLIELRSAIASVEHLKALGELTAGVAHEIRNPLNAIGIAVQRLSSEFEPESEKVFYHELLDGLKKEIKRLDNIVREFIGLSAPMAPNLVKQPLLPLIEEVVSSVRMRADALGIELETDIDDPGVVPFDEEQLKKALMNLAKNAIEATPKNGKIIIKSKDEGESVLISIWDNGPPIPEKVRGKIGKPFVSSGKEGGTGIGLFVVFRVIREHDGRIDFKSDETGTEFIVSLPRERK